MSHAVCLVPGDKVTIDLSSQGHITMVISNGKRTHSTSVMLSVLGGDLRAALNAAEEEATDIATDELRAKADMEAQHDPA